MHPHVYIPSQYPDYDRCADCGTLRHVDPFQPDEVYKNAYWETANGRPTLAEQSFNTDVHTENGVTKNEFLLNLLSNKSTTVIEVACAPGNLLNRIIAGGYAEKVIGFEVDDKYEAEIRSIIGFPAELRFGYFPQSSQGLHNNCCQAIVASDVLEHSFDPVGFVKECFRLLDNSGVLVLMLPMVEADGSLQEDRARHREHVHLFSKACLTEILEDAGFQGVEYDAWHCVHQSVRAVKP
jgi:SAM-dependent methyltransferase